MCGSLIACEINFDVFSSPHVSCHIFISHGATLSDSDVDVSNSSGPSRPMFRKIALTNLINGSLHSLYTTDQFAHQYSQTINVNGYKFVGKQNK